MKEHISEIARATDRQIRELLKKSTLSQYRVGGLLATVQEHNLWTELGATSFGRYVESIGLSYNSAWTWMRVHAAFSPLVKAKELNEEQLAEVGICKLYYLTYVIYDQEPALLLEDAMGRTIEEMDSMTRAARGLAEIPLKRAKTTFRFDKPSGKEIVDRAIEALIDGDHATSRAGALEFMSKMMLEVVKAA